MSATIVLRERLLRPWSAPAPVAAAAPAPAIVLLRPPYLPEGLRTAGPDLSGLEEVSGTVVGVRLRGVLVDVEPVRAILDDFARRVPACPAVVFLDTSGEQALAMFARLATLPARAVVPVGLSLPFDLQAALTDRAPLPTGVVAWVRSRGVRLNTGQADVIQRMLREAPAYASAGTLLRDQGIAPSSARFRLRKRRLPSTGQWYQLGRALQAALELQAHPELSLARVAGRLGFVDHSALAHLLRRSFRTTSREIRGTLGWEWLLSRWWSARQRTGA